MNRQRFPLSLCAVVSLLMIGLGLPLKAAVPVDPNPIIGTWEGTIDPGGQPKKRITVNVSLSQDGTLSGTIDFPDQSISGVIMTAITFKNGVLHFESASGTYDGTMNKENSEIAGSWKTTSAPVSVNLKRTP